MTLKKEKQLTEIQKETLVGSLLGDGALAQRRENKNARFHVRMGSLHKKELNNLYEIFKDMCKTPPKESLLFNKITQKEYNVISFMTLSYPCLNYYRKIFYNNGVKTVPLNIENLLTARGLAQWIMDDGGIDGKGLRLYTNSFLKESLELLQFVLANKFGIKSNIVHINKRRNLNQYKLYIKVESMDLLRTLVKPFMLPTMYYKLNL